jgi:hypothetical protein
MAGLACRMAASGRDAHTAHNSKRKTNRRPGQEESNTRGEACGARRMRAVPRLYCTSAKATYVCWEERACHIVLCCHP